MSRNRYDDILERNAKVSIGARVSPTDLATIANYLVLKGQKPKNRSDLICAGIEMAAAIVLARDEAVRFESNSDAFEYLQEVGLPIDQGYDRRGPIRARQFDELRETAKETQELERLQEKYKNTADKINRVPVEQPTTKEDILAKHRNQHGEDEGEDLEDYLPPKASKIPDNLKPRKDS